ncbi:MAG: class I SAM-dependent methyltransferase [Tepidisphaeraceae bacterium]|jgi:SAM-dependent methyltransferase
MATTPIKVFDSSGAHVGYLRNRQYWWFELQFPHSFELFDLDPFYEDIYFENDHVFPDVIKQYVDSVLDYGRRLTGRPVTSVLEVGSGGGWFTREFLNRGIDLVAIEGSRAGIAKSTERGVPSDRLVHHDLRRPIQLGRRFDVAVCTEVAEHLECPFSGQLVQTLVDHSDVIWFSFEPPGTNEAHYHHCNEQPAKFWLNLFKFHDYRAVKIPDALCAQLSQRGKYIFCGRNIIIPPDMASVTTFSSWTSAGENMAEGDSWKK